MLWGDARSAAPSSCFLSLTVVTGCRCGSRVREAIVVPSAGTLSCSIGLQYVFWISASGNQSWYCGQILTFRMKRGLTLHGCWWPLACGDLMRIQTTTVWLYEYEYRTSTNCMMLTIVYTLTINTLLLYEAPLIVNTQYLQLYCTYHCNYAWPTIPTISLLYFNSQ